MHNKGPVSLPPRGGPRDLLVTDANRDKPADPPYERGLDCGDDVLFRLRGWELVMGELVAVSLTGFVEGCHDRVDNSGRGGRLKNRYLTSEVVAQYYLIRRSCWIV